MTGVQSEVSSSIDRRSFNVAKDPIVQNGTVADALRSVPGVDVDMEGRVSLRGDPGVTIMLDGRPSAELQGEQRSVTLESMTASQIERVEIISNPSAAMSPEGSAGVINLVTKRGSRGLRSATVRAAVGLHGRGNVDANGTLPGKKLKLTGDLSYRRFRGPADSTLERERTDPSTGAMVRTRQTTEDRTAMQMHSGRLGAEYDISPRSRLTGNLSYRGGNQGGRPVVQSMSELPAATFERRADTDISLRSLIAKTSWRRTLPGRGHELVVDFDFDKMRQRRRIDGVTNLLKTALDVEVELRQRCAPVEGAHQFALLFGVQILRVGITHLIGGSIHHKTGKIGVSLFGCKGAQQQETRTERARNDIRDHLVIWMPPLQLVCKLSIGHKSSSSPMLEQDGIDRPRNPEANDCRHGILSFTHRNAAGGRPLRSLPAMGKSILAIVAIGLQADRGSPDIRPPHLSSFQM